MNIPLCPICKTELTKSGISDKSHPDKSKQRYRCKICDSTTSTPLWSDDGIDKVDPHVIRFIVTDIEYYRLMERAAIKHMSLNDYLKWSLFESH